MSWMSLTSDVAVPQATERPVTLCKNGHLLTPENIYVRPGRRRGAECLECRKDAGERYRRRNGMRPRTLLNLGLPLAQRAFCRNGHRMTPENTYTRKAGWVECQTCKRVGRARDVDLSESEVRSVIEALKEGLTIKKITGESPGFRPMKIVSKTRLLNFKVKNPAIYESMLASSRRNLAIIRASSGPAISKTITATDSWLDEEALPLVNKAVSDHIPFFMRDDIKQELMVMLWSREIRPDQIATTAKRLLSKQYSGYDLSSKFGHFSLDAAMFDDSARNRYDTISEEQRLWA